MADRTYTDEIKHMKHLMGFDSKKQNKPATTASSIVEYHQKGPDGQTYGILREGSKYYIKVAPKKDTEVLAEDYDYIGGIGCKKEYEYNSYSVASKQFGLKMMSLNEAYSNANKVRTDISYKEQPKVNESSAEAVSMSSEVRRMNELLYNMGMVLAEDKQAYAKGYKGNVDFKGGNPFVETPYTTEKVNNMKENESDPKKADDAVYTQKAEFKEIFDSAAKNKKEDPYTDEINRRDIEGVAVASTMGDKVNKGKVMNEGRKVIVTEAQILAMSKDPNFMDTSKGTEIGDSKPYSEKVNEDEVAWDDTVGAEKETDIDTIDDTEDDIDFIDPIPEDDDETIIDRIEREDDDVDDGIERIYEVALDAYGKHPAYRKQPMDLPANKEVSKIGHEGDDDSVNNDTPFGTEKGKGDPYTERIIDLLTDGFLRDVKKK